MVYIGQNYRIYWTKLLDLLSKSYEIFWALIMGYFGRKLWGKTMGSIGETL